MEPTAASLLEGFLADGSAVPCAIAAARAGGRTTASRARFPNPQRLPTSYGCSWKAGQGELCQPSPCVLHQKREEKSRPDKALEGLF